MKVLFYSIGAAVLLSTSGCMHRPFWQNRDNDRDRDRVRDHDHHQDRYPDRYQDRYERNDRIYRR